MNLKRFALLVCCGFLLSLPALAQDEAPRVDIFGGYSHVSNFDIGLSGWLACANYDVNRWLGVEADVNGQYGTQDLGAAPIILPGVPNKIHSRMHSFNAGPSATYRAGKYDAFGHFLLGFSHTNLNASRASDGDTSFSWVLGGGADYNLSKSWAARLQLDLLRTNFFSVGANHARVGLGVVYRLGEQ